MIIKFTQKFSQPLVFDSLKSEPKLFWIELADRYLIKAPSVTIIGRPSETMMHAIGDEEKQRVEERRKKLGKKGLKELRVKVKNAIDQNDV